MYWYDFYEHLYSLKELKENDFIHNNYFIVVWDKNCKFKLTTKHYFQFLSNEMKWNEMKWNLCERFRKKII
jgi:hypothetical protein